MGWFTLIQRSIDMPSLKLSVARGESFFRWRVSVIVVAWPRGSEALNAIMVITLISFTNESDVGGTWDSRDFSFLLIVSSVDFTI